jgi:predicted nuclease with RNAse H fold
MHAGVDFGAKIAGTTAICYSSENELLISQTEKNEDADAFILNLVKSKKVATLFIDAPLSLPQAYFGKGGDYMFRKADRQLKAMSPMFLGGLTARAMQLKHFLKEHHVECYETYPKYIALHYLGDYYMHYKKDKQIPNFLLGLSKLLPYPFKNEPNNWHQVDAALAWYSGNRHLQKKSISFGDSNEGIIII